MYNSKMPVDRQKDADPGYKLYHVHRGISHIGCFSSIHLDFGSSKHFGKDKVPYTKRQLWKDTC